MLTYSWFLAGVVKLVDTPDLGSGGASRGGSSPSARTMKYLTGFYRWVMSCKTEEI
tara:strand:+ start:231 stop:398 length:168 start_codon:yes stop_codon:yes gene_type:complete